VTRLVGAVVAALALVALALPAGPALAADDRRSGGNPCKMLTRGEVADAFAQPAAKGSRALGPTFCQWDLVATAERAVGQVNGLLERGKAANRDFRLAGDFADTVAVEGIGRKALYTPSSTTLWVLEAGPTLFYIQANVFAPDGSRVTEGVLDVLTGLATRAEARV